MIKQQTIAVHTQGRGSYDITSKVDAVISESGAQIGLCHLFIQHTSASLILCENADPTVRKDLDAFMARLVPDGDAIFRHTAEGDDDMPAHIRTILTHSSLSIPISHGRCGLGTWQGVYLWEHRTHPHHRQVTITVQSE
ncbi:MAG: secondary thiamine-phosphate synthase enzyme YjbQ [Gammaproteobacteria bacterium]